MSKNIFVSSSEIFEWLSDFINLERGQKPKSFRIDRMEFLTKIAGNPALRAPSIHVAGSKGKGSVTAMSAAILSAAGFRVARFMSPHVIDIRERLCLGDAYFDEEIYLAAGNELREIAETRLPAAKNPLFEEPEGSAPTFFELLTLFFFLCAKKADCDAIVAETGMGGRLDSTNVLNPLVSVITMIELEHTFFLGGTLEEIAGEKAGIIKRGKPLVLARQKEEALEVFRKTTKEKNSSLFYFPETTELSDVKITKSGTDFTLSSALFPAPLPVSIPIPGKVQAENAALAITAVKIAFPETGEDAIRRGLSSVKIPGRFEKIHKPDGKEPPFIIDGAHTPESLRLCVETFNSLYGEGGVLVFGCAADKDALSMAKIAGPRFARIIITTPGNFKVSDPPLVYKTFAEIAGPEKTELVEDTEKAVRLAVELAKNQRGDKPLPILGTGSFYLVSEIRKTIGLFSKSGQF